LYEKTEVSFAVVVVAWKFIDADEPPLRLT